MTAAFVRCYHSMLPAALSPHCRGIWRTDLLQHPYARVRSTRGFHIGWAMMRRHFAYQRQNLGEAKRVEALVAHQRAFGPSDARRVRSGIASLISAAFGAGGASSASQLELAAQQPPPCAGSSCAGSRATGC